MAETDEELVQRVPLNRLDQVASRHLVDCHSRAVYNLAFRLLGNRTDAEDVAQESFLEGVPAARDFRPDASIRAVAASDRAQHRD